MNNNGKPRKRSAYNLDYDIKNMTQMQSTVTSFLVVSPVNVSVILPIDFRFEKR
jgi:hypothetical protein